MLSETEDGLVSVKSFCSSCFFSLKEQNTEPTYSLEGHMRVAGEIHWFLSRVTSDPAGKEKQFLCYLQAAT